MSDTPPPPPPEGRPSRARKPSAAARASIESNNLEKERLQARRKYESELANKKRAGGAGEKQVTYGSRGKGKQSTAGDSNKTPPPTAVASKKQPPPAPKSKAAAAEKKRNRTRSSGSSSDESEDTKPPTPPKKKPKKKKTSSKDESKKEEINRPSDEEFNNCTADIWVQLLLHKGRTYPKLKANTVLMVNQSNRNSDRNREFKLDLDYSLITDFDGDVLGEIETFVKENSGFELNDFGTNNKLYHRNSPLDTDHIADVTDKKCHSSTLASIGGMSDWKKALKSSSYVVCEKDGSIKSLHMPIICTVSDKPSAKKQTTSKKATQSESQAASQLLQQQQQQLDEEQEDADGAALLEGCPYGHDMKVLLRFLPPTKKMRNQDEDDTLERYSLATLKNDFDKGETLLLDPPYADAEEKLEFLREAATEKDLKRNQLKTRLPIGYIRRQAMKHAYGLSYYQDSNKDCIMGCESHLYIQTNSAAKLVIKCDETAKFWKHAKKKHDALKGGDKKEYKDTVIVHVSIGHKGEEGIEYEPVQELTVIESDDDSVASDQTPKKRNVGPTSDDYLFSQQDQQLLSPPYHKTKKSLATQRAEATLDGKTTESFIWKATTENPDCDWYHAISIQRTLSGAEKVYNE